MFGPNSPNIADGMGAGIDPFGMAPSQSLIRGETLGQHNINIDNNDQNPKNSGR